MATKNQTVETNSSVSDFINAVEDDNQRKDSIELARLMEKVSGKKAKMWGPAIIGFGSCHYKYESGREGDTPLIAFSPRKNAISLYLWLSEADRTKFLPDLGKHKTGKGCIYAKKLTDIDTEVLKKMCTASIKYLEKLYGK